MHRAACVAMLALGAGAWGQDLFVSSPATDAVKRYDWQTGAYLGDFVASGTGGLEHPTAIGFGPDGHLYVGSGPNSQILRYDGATGAYIDEFIGPSHFQGGPSDLVFRDDKLYVSQWNPVSPFNGGVLVFDASTGAFIETLVSDVTRSSSLALDEEGSVFLSEFGTSQVHRYSSTGELLMTYAGPGEISGAMGVGLDAEGRLLIGSWNEGSVKRFDVESGELLGVVASGLAHTGSFIFAPDGTLLADDYDNGRIARFEPATGELLGYAAEGGGLGPPEKFTLGPVPAPSSVPALLGILAMARRRCVRRTASQKAENGGR